MSQGNIKMNIRKEMHYNSNQQNIARKRDFFQVYESEAKMLTQ